MAIRASFLCGYVDNCYGEDAAHPFASSEVEKRVARWWRWACRFSTSLETNGSQYIIPAQCAVMPPSITISDPVMKLAAGLAR